MQLPAREYVLFVGPLAGLPSLMEAQGGRSPNLWWPEDRAWCVATEIDLAWLIAMTTLCVVMLARPRGMGRPGGALLIAMYAGFWVVTLVAT